jgi:hypothetical protein
VAAGTALAAALLARLGVEDDPSDAAVTLALTRLPWSARKTAETYHAAELARRPEKRVPGLPPGMALASAVPEDLEPAPVGTPSAEPWAHVSAREVRRLIAAARTELARPPTLLRCTDGPCGLCGVRLSTSWHGVYQMAPTTGLEHARRWPLCSTCEDLRIAGGGVLNSVRVRVGATADVLGVRPSMSTPPAIRYYCEMTEATPTDAEGCAERWGFVTDEDRADLYALAPQHRPAELRDREARIAAAAARMAAAREPRRRSAVIVAP